MCLFYKHLLAADDVEAGGEGVDVGLRGVAFEAYALQVVDVVGTDGIGCAVADYVVDAQLYLAVGGDGA